MKHNILIFLLFLVFRFSAVTAGEWKIVSEMPVPVSFENIASAWCAVVQAMIENTEEN